MLAHFQKLNIQRKLIISYAILIANILLLLFIGTGAIIKHIIINHTNDVAINDIKVVTNSIEFKLNNIELCSNMLVIGLNELQFLKDDTKISITEKSILERNLYRAITAYGDISNAIFLDQKGNVYGTNIAIAQSFKDKLPTELIQTVSSQSTKPVWFDIGVYKPFLPEGDERALVVAGKNVHDIISGNLIGYLFLVLDESQISNVYEDLGITKHSQYFIVNDKGEVLSSTDKSLLLTNFPLSDSQKEKPTNVWFNGSLYVQNAKPITKLGVDLVYIVPINEILKDMNALIIYFGICTVLFFLFGIFLAIVLSKYLSKPILDLCERISQVRKDMGARIETVESQNEIEVLGITFNSMIVENNELVERIKDGYEKKRLLQLSLIQSQIKPHFLYNALDTIYILAHMGMTDSAKTTTKALADFYRIALSGGKEFIPIGSELKNVEDYLKIQKLRYEGLFECVEQIDVSLNHYLIPKLSIQPLVENAIYHGLKEGERVGTLTISTEDKGNKIAIIVHDNGIGIKPERLDSLLLDENSDSFGLKSVDTRIKLYFGNEYGLIIKSEYTSFTEITILIPKREEEGL